jgi:hypothetical protein
MAYTDPNTGVRRDKYGNEIARDPTGTDPHSHTNYWMWALAAIFVLALLYAVFGSVNTANAPTPSDTSVTQPAAPKAPPPTP